MSLLQRREEESQRREKKAGWWRRMEADREAGWSKGGLSPPAAPSVHVRPSPSLPPDPTPCVSILHKGWTGHLAAPPEECCGEVNRTTDEHVGRSSCGCR